LAYDANYVVHLRNNCSFFSKQPLPFRIAVFPLPGTIDKNNITRLVKLWVYFLVIISL
jgi:hypothetical protein